MSTIGERMRELRGPSSQKEMAEAIGIKYNAWARYEAGGALPGAEIITKICRVHACSADWLLGLTDDGTKHQPRTTNHEPPTTNHQPRTTNHQPPTSPPADCSKCKLMIAHIREITGRK